MQENNQEERDIFENYLEEASSHKRYYKEAVAYLRYSDNKQDEGVSIEYQMKEVNDYARKHGYTITKWYIDRATSARKVAGRDNFIQLFKDVESGNTPPNLIVFATNRAFRNAYESHKYREVLRENGVKLSAVMQDINEDTSAGRLNTNILASIDQYKAEEIGEHVSAAMRLLISEGFSTGGPAPYGFAPAKVMFHGSERVKFVPYEPEAAIVREFFEGVRDGKSIREMSKIFYDRGIRNRKGEEITWYAWRNMFDNIMYIGERYFTMKMGDDVYNPNYCEPIITKELFNEAHKVFKEASNKTKGRNKGRIFPLTGKLTCSCCGRPMVGNSSQGLKSEKGVYYVCPSRSTAARRCGLKNVNRTLLEKAVFEVVVEKILSDEAIDTIAKAIMEQIKKAPAIAEDKNTLLNRKKEITETVDRMVQLYSKNLLNEEELSRNKMPLDDELAAINRKLSKIAATIDDAIDEVYIRKQINAIFYRDTEFEKCPKELLKELFRKTIENIEVSNTQVVIHLRIPLPNILDKINYGSPLLNLSKTIDYPQAKMGRPKKKREE